MVNTARRGLVPGWQASSTHTQWAALQRGSLQTAGRPNQRAGFSGCAAGGGVRTGRATTVPGIVAADGGRQRHSAATARLPWLECMQ